MYGLITNPRRRLSGQKTEVCEVPGCGKAFFHRTDLYRHQRIKHGAGHKRATYRSDRFNPTVSAGRGIEGMQQEAGGTENPTMLISPDMHGSMCMSDTNSNEVTAYPTDLPEATEHSFTNEDTGYQSYPRGDINSS